MGIRHVTRRDFLKTAGKLTALMAMGSIPFAALHFGQSMTSNGYVLDII
ncbi:MAG TPA: twin-arginine translocation signal domain-containing protein [Nitrospirota bacterium]|nr:twin-arginine translocation signal domain-containing protein [Nitrospirota bacterium]